MVWQLLMFAIYTLENLGRGWGGRERVGLEGWNKRETGGSSVDINPPGKGKWEKQSNRQNKEQDSVCWIVKAAHTKESGSSETAGRKHRNPPRRETRIHAEPAFYARSLGHRCFLKMRCAIRAPNHASFFSSLWRFRISEEIPPTQSPLISKTSSLKRIGAGNSCYGLESQFKMTCALVPALYLTGPGRVKGKAKFNCWSLRNLKYYSFICLRLNYFSLRPSFSSWHKTGD